MARISVSIINKLKESYIKLIKKKYKDEIKTIENEIGDQKLELLKQISVDVTDYIKNKYPNVNIKNVGSYYYNEIRIELDIATDEIENLNARMNELKKISSEKLDELDDWEIEALKSGIEENIPTFEV